jgi:hypothetical protein
MLLSCNSERRVTAEAVVQTIREHRQGNGWPEAYTVPQTEYYGYAVLNYRKSI